MEQDQTSVLFNLSIDPVTKAHLSETAKWARFLAIVYMILMVLVLVGILYFTYYMSTLTNNFGDQYGTASPFSGFGVGMAITYIVLIAVWFFPTLYLLRFANRMKVALSANDQNALNTSFQNLKICFRFIGIVTIITLALYALVIIFAVIGAAAFS